jgi:TonB family protein
MNHWARTVIILATAAGPGLAQSSDSSLAHLRAGEALLKQHNLQEAAIEFAQVAKGDHQPAWTLVWSHIDLGRTFDATGQRERAVKEYNLALETKDNTFGALGFANEYLWKAPPLYDVSPLPGDSADFTGPAVLTRVDPEYSAEGLLARLEGSVTIAASVAKDGSITGLQLLRPLGLGMDEAALNAVRRWTFAPATDHQQPVPGVIPVTIQFHLPSRTPGWHVTKIQFAEPDAAVRPVLMHTGAFVAAKAGTELAEEAAIDAAISRVPDVTLAMEIDTLGNPSRLQVNAASLPIWGDDAVRAISEWRFRPATKSETAIAVPCVIELGWFAPQ